jgi:DNA-binding NtrC family response regulator
MDKAARILVVDDDPAVRALIEGVLQVAGYATASAGSAPQALSLLDRQKFDLVITDKNMSGMDGHMLITEIGLRFPGVGAVMVTGFRTEESEKQAQEQHVLGYLEKPIFDLDKVTQTIAAAMVEQRRRHGA